MRLSTVCSSSWASTPLTRWTTTWPWSSRSVNPRRRHHSQVDREAATETASRSPERGGVAAAYAASVRKLPLPQRVTRAVGESPNSERVAQAQEMLYGPVIDWARRSPLHTDALGHSVHPLLT